MKTNKTFCVVRVRNNKVMKSGIKKEYKAEDLKRALGYQFKNEKFEVREEKQKVYLAELADLI